MKTVGTYWSTSKILPWLLMWPYSEEDLPGLWYTVYAIYFWSICFNSTVIYSFVGIKLLFLLRKQYQAVDNECHKFTKWKMKPLASFCYHQNKCIKQILYQVYSFEVHIHWGMKRLCIIMTNVHKIYWNVQCIYSWNKCYLDNSLSL